MHCGSYSTRKVKWSHSNRYTNKQSKSQYSIIMKFEQEMDIVLIDEETALLRSTPKETKNFQNHSLK